MFEFFFTVILILFCAAVSMWLFVVFLEALGGAIPVIIGLLAYTLKIFIWIIKVSFFIAYFPFILLWRFAKKYSNQQPQ